MKVLQVHNRYRLPGGEDSVIANEAGLLRQRGHEVHLLEVINPEHDPASPLDKVRQGINVIWSPAGAATVRKHVLELKPDVVHFHNTFAQLSAAALRAVRSLGVPVVQTLHNYRTICANGLLMRNGVPCEECVDGSRLHAAGHACYRGSRAASAAIALAGAVHLGLGTYSGRGIRAIVLTHFAREIFVRAGFDESAISVKPNFVFPFPAGESRKQSVVFVGRLAEEKGIDTVLDAWKRFHTHNVDWTLEVIGDGPLRGSVEQAGEDVLALGWLSPEAVRSRVSTGRYLVMGSRWYEGLPMVAIEALSVGTPLILPRLGSMTEMVADGACGFGYVPGSATALEATLGQATGLSAADWSRLSQAASARYETLYSPETNYRQLMQIYRTVILECQS